MGGAGHDTLVWGPACPGPWASLETTERWEERAAQCGMGGAAASPSDGAELGVEGYRWMTAAINNRRKRWLREAASGQEVDLNLKQMGGDAW
jgi:hypothetical protein